MEKYDYFACLDYARREGIFNRPELQDRFCLDYESTDALIAELEKNGKIQYVGGLEYKYIANDRAADTVGSADPNAAGNSAGGFGVSEKTSDDEDDKSDDDEDDESDEEIMRMFYRRTTVDHRGRFKKRLAEAWEERRKKTLAELDRRLSAVLKACELSVEQPCEENDKLYNNALKAYEDYSERIKKEKEDEKAGKPPSGFAKRRECSTAKKSARYDDEDDLIDETPENPPQLVLPPQVKPKRVGIKSEEEFKEIFGVDLNGIDSSEAKPEISEEVELMMPDEEIISDADEHADSLPDPAAADDPDDIYNIYNKEKQTECESRDPLMAKGLELREAAKRICGYDSAEGVYTGFLRVLLPTGETVGMSPIYEKPYWYITDCGATFYYLSRSVNGELLRDAISELLGDGEVRLIEGKLIGVRVNGAEDMAQASARLLHAMFLLGSQLQYYTPISAGDKEIAKKLLGLPDAALVLRAAELILDKRADASSLAEALSVSAAKAKAVLAELCKLALLDDGQPTRALSRPLVDYIKRKM